MTPTRTPVTCSICSTPETFRGAHGKLADGSRLCRSCWEPRDAEIMAAHKAMLAATRAARKAAGATQSPIANTTGWACIEGLNRAMVGKRTR